MARIEIKYYDKGREEGHSIPKKNYSRKAIIETLSKYEELMFK